MAVVLWFLCYPGPEMGTGWFGCLTLARDAGEGRVRARTAGTFGTIGTAEFLIYTAL